MENFGFRGGKHKKTCNKCSAKKNEHAKAHENYLMRGMAGLRAPAVASRYVFQFSCDKSGSSLEDMRRKWKAMVYEAQASLTRSGESHPPALRLRLAKPRTD